VHSGYFSAQSIILGYLTKNAVNAITGHSRELLASTFILATVLSFGSFVINPIAFYVKFIVTRTMLMDTRKKAIFHMEKLKIPYFDKKHSGDILSRLSSDITQVDNFFAVFREFLILLFTGLGSRA
jgi:ATP-binding cassette subfamily B protein